MILDRPTGSYASVLPKEPTDSTSVVYTISSTDPPRSELNFGQIPTGVAARQRDGRFTGDRLRRSNYGILVFTLKDNYPGRVETGNQMFYVGQVFDFEDVAVPDIELTNTALQTEHDQHYVDAGSVGLSDPDLVVIEGDAVIIQEQVLSELEELQKYESNLRVTIGSQQRIINEANRVLDALDVILDKDPNNNNMAAYRQQVIEKRAEAQIILDEAVDELNAIPAQIDQKHTQLRALAPVID